MPLKKHKQQDSRKDKQNDDVDKNGEKEKEGEGNSRGGQEGQKEIDARRAQFLDKNGDIKRPANGFLLYSRKRRPELKDDNSIKDVLGERKTAAISKILQKEWNDLGADIKNEYLKKGEELRLEHKELFPDYKYKRAPNGQGKRNKNRKRIKLTTKQEQPRNSVQSSTSMQRATFGSQFSAQFDPIDGAMHAQNILNTNNISNPAMRHFTMPPYVFFPNPFSPNNNVNWNGQYPGPMNAAHYINPNMLQTPWPNQNQPTNRQQSHPSPFSGNPIIPYTNANKSSGQSFNTGNNWNGLNSGDGNSFTNSGMDVNFPSGQAPSVCANGKGKGKERASDMVPPSSTTERMQRSSFHPYDRNDRQYRPIDERTSRQSQNQLSPADPHPPSHPFLFGNNTRAQRSFLDPARQYQLVTLEDVFLGKFFGEHKQCLNPGDVASSSQPPNHNMQPNIFGNLFTNDIQPEGPSYEDAMLTADPTVIVAPAPGPASQQPLSDTQAERDYLRSVGFNLDDIESGEEEDLYSDDSESGSDEFDSD